MTLAAGIHDDIAAVVYHGDPCETPSLSSSIARILIGKSPAHACAAHPKLHIPELTPDRDPRFDIGIAAHALFLEGADVIAVYAGDSWRKNEAKAFRDEQHELGRIPLLLEQAGDVKSMVAEARAQIHAYRATPPLFADGKPEQTLVWEDDHDVVCRARLDWLRDDYEAIDDYKSTSASSDPRKWDRTMYGMGCDVQVAFYMRGVERLTGIRPVFRFVVQETYPPYVLSVVDLAPAALAFANDKVQRAIDVWAECLSRDEWPGYDRRVASIELPTWAEMDWLARNDSEVAA